MKNAHISVLVFLLFLGVDLFAQAGIDTIRMDLGNNRSLMLISDDLNVFSKISIDSIVMEVRKHYGGEFFNSGNIAVRDTYIVATKDGKIVQNEADSKRTGTSTTEVKYSHPQSIVFVPAIGIGLVRNQLASFASLGIDNLIGPPRRTRYGFGIAANPYFFFSKEDGKTKAFCNTFLDASILFRAYTEQGKKFRFGAGYLVQREGDYYDRNTSRIFLMMSPVWDMTIITVAPELIITGFFKKAYPGVGFRFLW